MTAHLFSTPAARQLYNAERKRMLGGNPDFSTLEGLRKRIHRALTQDDSLSASQREVLMFLQTDIVDSQSSIAPRSHDIARLSPDAAASAHEALVAQTEAELEQARESRDPAWIAQQERLLHNLQNVSRVAEEGSKGFQPWFENERTKQRYEEAGQREVIRIEPADHEHALPVSPGTPGNGSD